MRTHTLTPVVMLVLAAACAEDPTLAGRDPFVADAPADAVAPPPVDTPVDSAIEEDEDTGDLLDTGLDPLTAELDGDSQTEPAATYRFTPYGDRELVFSDEVSTPGDLEDWVQLHTLASENDKTKVTLQLDCDVEGSDTSVVARVYEGKGLGAVATTFQVSCATGTNDRALLSNRDYLVRIAVQNPPGPTWAAYTLTVRN
ncbi:MAG: hypothetical protein H6732_19965 [Alphaproteobacteria bacterium]|nr:hypothetical protein [Alphaproteobacteria bacterium]